MHNTHILGRTVRVTLPRSSDYPMFLRLAVQASFDWVYYATSSYVRLSVIPSCKLLFLNDRFHFVILLLSSSLFVLLFVVIIIVCYRCHSYVVIIDVVVIVYVVVVIVYIVIVIVYVVIVIVIIIL